MHGSEYWKQNQYYKYFQQVWGNAPLLDANFKLWMKGYFKSFHVPNQARAFQQTKALPAFLHYYGKTYDPLLDPPYASDFDLFGRGSGTQGDKNEAAPIVEGKTGKVRDDCTRSPFKNALGYKRPCGINEILAKSWTKEKYLLPLNKVLGKNSYWEGNHGGAGSQRGTTYWTYNKLPPSPSEEGESAWIGMDKSWSNSRPASGHFKDDDNTPDKPKELKRPDNIPPPPEKALPLPIFQLGEKKKVNEEEKTKE